VLVDGAQRGAQRWWCWGALVASSGMSTRLWTFGVEDCEGESVGGEAVEVAAMDASDEAVAA
jgi:hypothetical protein